MQRLEVSGVVGPIYGSLSVKRLISYLKQCVFLESYTKQLELLEVSVL